MKPIRLTIEGINSFTDAQTLDFETVGRSSLFCICGKTGAGKTTIFDSIMFALYGKSGKGNLADTVNLSRDRARVVLEFEAGGDRYRVERRIKCRAEKDENGEPTGKRLATATDCMLEKNGEPQAKGSDDVTAKCAALIGLDESEFKNVYMLEQGEYAEFLKKQPAKQLEAVGKIFSLMRFGDVHKLANEKMKDADAAKKAVETRIADLGDVSTASVQQVKSDLAALRKNRTALDRDVQTRSEELLELGKTRDLYLTAVQKQKHVADLAVRLDDANGRLKTAEKEECEFLQNNDGAQNETELKDLRDRLNALSELGALDRACCDAENDYNKKLEELSYATGCAEGEREDIKKRENAAQAEKDAFAVALARFCEAAQKQEKKSEPLSRALGALGAETTASAVTSCYYELSSEKNDYEQLVKRSNEVKAEADTLLSQAADALKKSEELVKAKSVFESELKRAADLFEKAEAELAAARLSSQAAAVASELHAGDVCPVCGGVFNGCAHGGADVARAKTERDNAAQAVKAAEKRADELERTAQRANDDYARLSREAEGKSKETQELFARVAAMGVNSDIYKEMLSALETAKGRAESMEKATAELERARPKLAAAKSARDGAQKAADEAKKKSEELAARLGDMRGKTSVAIMDVKTKISVVEKEVEEYERKKRGYAEQKKASAAAVKAVEDMLAEARRDCPLDMPEFDEDEYKAKQAGLDGIKNEVAELNVEIARSEERQTGMEEQLEKYKSLKAESDGHAKRADMYKTISDMTKGKAMLDFVATEYIQAFTAAASNILGSLSGGKYSMRYDGGKDGGFMVSDYLNGGKTRKTDTLSGGELFLASLAVAIAISREVGSDDNAFFFLDEGFGTLDDELIDVVYGALEELAKTCLVGVISHSGSLIERMPSCVEVIEASDAAGSRIIY